MNHQINESQAQGPSFSEDGQSPAFTAVAPYYDELMKQVPYRMWVGYYLLLLSQQDVHPESILDVCCGTGTMCEMLSVEGFYPTGIDFAPAMIEEATRKAHEQDLMVRYEVADAVTFDLGRTFDSALSFFDSLNNIIEPDRFQSALTQVGRHLEPGGSFIFDLNTAFAFEEHLFDQKHLRQNARLRYDWKGEWDPATRLITVRMNFWYRNREFEEVHVQRAYADEDVRRMLREAGFGLIRTYHSYTLDPPRPTSDRIHYTAIKL